MFVWIVYDYVEELILGTYNADIWKRLDVADEVMRIHDINTDYLLNYCEFYHEKVL